MMNRPARRHRERAATDREIRRTARALLVEHGPEAVTLRAIARELGITAPALYRYYGSRDDLVEHLRHDIVADLGTELASDTAVLPDDAPRRLLAICRGFRHWALSHTNEFTLVFASPTGEVGTARSSVATLNHASEPLGHAFLLAAGRVLATHAVAAPADEDVPPEVRDDLATYRDSLLTVLTESGLNVTSARFTLGTTYLMTQFWARIYGHVTLEVFGNYPLPVSKPDTLFDTMLADLAREIGLGEVA